MCVVILHQPGARNSARGEERNKGKELADYKVSPH